MPINIFLIRNFFLDDLKTSPRSRAFPPHLRAKEQPVIGLTVTSLGAEYKGTACILSRSISTTY
jgi:hypothetical protein